MAYKQMNKNRGRIGFVILCLVVLIGGFALSQSNDLQNPLSMTSRLLSTTEMAGEGMPSGESSENMGERTTRPEGEDFEGGERGGTMEFWDIEWSEIGAVFYNLWLMLATTVIVIVVARPIGYLIKHLKPNRKRAIA